MYGAFAFLPGTVAGLYLYSVRQEMNRENERVRLEQVEDELQVEIARERKDEVLVGMIEDLRNRIRHLEDEALAKNQDVKPTTGDSHKAATTDSEAVPASTSMWDKRKEALKTAIGANTAPAPAVNASPSGINERVKQRQEDQLKQDIRAYRAAKADKAARE